MTASASSRTTARGTVIVHGVDFSGADGGGAAKIRVAERELAPRSAVRVRGRLDRAGLRRAILDSVRDARVDGVRHLWRIDAPFGLPIACFETERPEGLPAGPLDWSSVARWVSAFPNARAWRTAMRESSRREPRRACDRELHTPMAPMNLRVFKQTFTVIREILVPLADEGVAIMPVSMPADGAAPSVAVCESCPASVLRARGWPAKGYKGGGEPPRILREEIIRLLRKDGLEIPSPAAVEAIHDAEGDLLDALLLATEPLSWTVPAEHAAQAAIEAWVY